VEYLRASTLNVHLEHHHGDRWVQLEPTPQHDAAESDPERAWASGGRIYRCPECDEVVRVDLDRDDRTPE
jgi:hypothetical protein